VSELLLKAQAETTCLWLLPAGLTAYAEADDGSIAIVVAGSSASEGRNQQVNPAYSGGAVITNRMFH
jgi:hypothetical protein